MNYGVAPMSMASRYAASAVDGRAPAMAMMPAQPVLAGALPCQLCQQYHPPNETCFQHASHHRQSQARHHHHRSRSRARHVSDSDSDRASRRSRRKSGRGHSSHRKHRRSSGRRRRARKASSSDSTESSVLSDSSSDSDFTPSAIQLLEMGERMAEDVGSSQPAPPIVPVGVPVPATVEPPAPRDFYQDIRRAYSRGGVLGQQPAEREGRAVRSLDPTQEELDVVRESGYAGSQLLNTPSMHPLGADESHFSSTPYLPVKGSPSLPPKARLSAAHPGAVSTSSMWDNDPLLGPDDLLPVPSAPPSMRRSQHGRPSPIRAPSSVHHHSQMEEEQIQAAMQHRSVSEAAFTLSGRGGASVAVARPARAAAPPSAFMSGRPALAYLPPPVDSTQLGPKVNSRGMHVMQPGDPRFYTAYQDHPYRIQPASKPGRHSHPITDRETYEADQTFCSICLGR